MQIRARVIDHLPTISGTSRSSQPWSKAGIITETIGQYPKKVALYNLKRADEFAAIPYGTVATFDLDIESREYQGRWYTEATCWNWNIEQQ